MFRSNGTRLRLLLTGLVLLMVLFQLSPAFSEDPAPTAEEASPEFVSIDFNNVDINVFIKFISRLSGKNFVVDNRVKGNVTIISPTKISVKEAYRVFESVLDINGYSTVEAGNITKIIPSTQARTDNVDTGMLNKNEDPVDKMVTRIVRLHYASSDELRSLLAPLVPKGSVLLSYGDTNMLIITATLASIDRLVRIVDAIDVESIGRTISVLPVKNADASKIVKILTNIYTTQTRRSSKNKSSQDEVVKMEADDRTNSIVLLASELETQRISSLIEMLDQEVPRGEERIRVYYLEHATAEDLASVLQEIPTKSSSNSKQTGQKMAPLLSDDIKITADKATNSLIIIADKDDYPVIEEVIKKLDIPRAMVYIECLIMEVNANKGLSLGTEWRVAQGYNNNTGVTVGGFGATGDGTYANASSLASGSLPQGFSLGVLGKTLSIGGVDFPSLQAVIQAYRSNKDVQILSTPQVLTTENEEAVMTVGKNVPYQTRSAAESSSETYSSYEYKDVGITLKITPIISQDRLVRMNVYQKVERLDSANETDTVRPTTLKRELETTIIVEDGNTVVIGGLIDESLSKTVNKTPCLGDIPVLGFAFRSQSSGSDKTNLYIFLTPRVVKNPREAKDIYKEKNDEIKTLKKQEIKLYDDQHPIKSLLLH